MSRSNIILRESLWTHKQTNKVSKWTKNAQKCFVYKAIDGYIYKKIRLKTSNKGVQLPYNFSRKMRGNNRQDGTSNLWKSRRTTTTFKSTSETAVFSAWNERCRYTLFLTSFLRKWWYTKNTRKWWNSSSAGNCLWIFCWRAPACTWKKKKKTDRIASHSKPRL